MTWSDDRGGPKKRVKPAIFAEKIQVKKPVPAWVAQREAPPHALTGWLSSRSQPPPATSAPPPALANAPHAPTTEKRMQVPPSVHPLPRASMPPGGHASSALHPNAEGIVQVMEARALSDSVQQASRSAYPAGPDRAYEAMAQHLPGTSSFLAAEAAADSERLEATIEALEKSVEELSLLRGRLMEETEEQLVTLAATIARRVIGREVAIDPEILLTLAAEGIDALGDRDKVVVRFGFLDRDDLLSSMVDRLKRRAPRCEVLQDPSLGPGQCVVESEFGQVDESVDARLDNVMRALLPSLPRRFG
jgi:flagellar assembly protein FliH